MPYEDAIRDALRAHGLSDANNLVTAFLELLRVLHVQAALRRRGATDLPVRLRDAARTEAELRRRDAQARKPAGRRQDERATQAAALAALADLLDYFIPVWNADVSLGMGRLRDAIKRRGGPPKQPGTPRRSKE